MGGVEFGRGHKFPAGQEGSTFVGGLIVNNTINLIIHEVKERWKLVAGGSGQINSRKISKPSNNPSK
jgi:hypothetical protein